MDKNNNPKVATYTLAGFIDGCYKNPEQIEDLTIITHIRVREYELRLPDVFDKFPNLERLSIHNGCNGKSYLDLVPSIFRCPKLEILETGFRVRLTQENLNDLANCTTLKELYFEYTKIDGVFNLEKLTKLEGLSLWRENDISNIDENFRQIVKAKSLKYLGLADFSWYKDNIKYLQSKHFENIHNMENLEVFSVDGEFVKEVHPDIYKMKNLKSLYLYTENSKPVTSDILNMKNLEKLFIYNNLYSGEIEKMTWLTRFEAHKAQRYWGNQRF